MQIVLIVAGIIGGIVLYSLHTPALVGAILGAAVSILLAKVITLSDKVSSLVEEIAELRSKRTDHGKEIDPKAMAEQEVQIEPPIAAPKPGPVSRPPEKPVGSTAALPASHPHTAKPETQPLRPMSAAAPTPPIPSPEKRRTPPPRPPRKNDENSPDLWDIALSYFTGGNVVVRVGVLVLFFGVAFLVKYSIERNLLPIEFRLAGIYLGGLTMLIIGWRLRSSREIYGLILQGGGVGILYLTSFGAMKLYHLLPFPLALGLMVGLAGFSATLAIIQDARSLAVIGIIGGFLAPVLTSTGGGSHVMLFSYYALLNGGILFTAWHKSWRELNLIGFLFTFAVGVLWGNLSYQPELFASTEPFLILFFLFYLTIGILFASNQPLNYKGYIDCTLVFGTPLVAFALQAVLVRPYPYAIAWSALALGLSYALIAWVIFRRGSPAMRTLVESYLALGIIFGTVAIPLALDGRWTSAAWALEGAAIVWVAIRQYRQLARVFGLLLQLGAGASFILAADNPIGSTPIVNGFYLGCLAVSLAGLFTGFCLSGRKNEIDTAPAESVLALLWGLCWWFGAGIHEIHIFVSHEMQPATALGFCGVSVLTFFLLGRKIFWSALCQVYKLLPPVMVGAAIISWATFHNRPSLHGGWLAWPLSFGIVYFLLAKDDRRSHADLLPSLHLSTFLLLIGLTTREAWWWTGYAMAGRDVWSMVVCGLLPALFVFIICRFREDIDWPLADYRETYLHHTLGVVCLYLWVASIFTNLTSTGDPFPIPYVPLLNPLDLTQMFVLGVLIYWALVVRSQLEVDPLGLDLRNLALVAGATIFFWLNYVLLRTIHHWGKVPLHSHDMIKSDLVQTSLSIFWTLSAFALMYFATNRSRRNLWLLGTTLIGIVVVKLFLFDLANTNTVERIISFIGVGVICLVIGYLAPMPQETASERASE